MATIKAADYNDARKILKKAGAKSADKSHNKHGTDGTVPEGHGQSLLAEARDEFRKLDKGKDEHKAGMVKDHYDAVHKAAKKMGISRW